MIQMRNSAGIVHRRYLRDQQVGNSFEKCKFFLDQSFAQLFQMNNFHYFFYLFSHLFHSYHFKGEIQADESALSALTEIMEKILK